MDGLDDSSLGLGFAFFELPQGGAFSFNDLNHSFRHIPNLVQDKGAFNSYDESRFIHQSFLSHMDLLSLITL
jgi:hypothetical protein